MVFSRFLDLVKMTGKFQVGSLDILGPFFYTVDSILSKIAVLRDFRVYLG